MTPIHDLANGTRPKPTRLRARCALCRAPSNDIEQVDALLPPVYLCRDHWVEYRSDWLLLGWCDDHYAEALKRCPVHNRVVEPL